jgi:hypothetical protein
VLLLARPAVVMLLMMFTATGFAQAGRPAGALTLARTVLAVNRVPAVLSRLERPRRRGH